MIDKEFFEKELQITASDFPFLCSMSSWAIDGHKHKSDEQDEEPATKKLKEDISQISSLQDISPSKRRELGLKCKRLIGNDTTVDAQLIFIRLWTRQTS